MMELIMVKDKTALTTSLAIAKGTEHSHSAIIKLARKYQQDLGEFGPFGFEIQKGQSLPQGGFAKPTQYALLNEPQATLLMTYMRNTDVVRKFKIRMVKAFYEMSQELHQASAPDRRSEIAHSRSTNAPGGLDIRYNLDLTKIIANPSRKSILLLSRLTGIDLEDIAVMPSELSLVTEQAMNQAEVKTFFNEACRADPGASIKAAGLYEAFTTWSRNRYPDRDPLSQKAFGTLATTFGLKRRRDSKGMVEYLDISLQG